MVIATECGHADAAPAGASPVSKSDCRRSGTMLSVGVKYFVRDVI